jgi:hypothetical protein
MNWSTVSRREWGLPLDGAAAYGAGIASDVVRVGRYQWRLENAQHDLHHAH